MTEPTDADQAMDGIRAEAAYVRIAGRYQAEGKKPSLAGLLAELHAALPDMPADRRAVAIAAVFDRVG